MLNINGIALKAIKYFQGEDGMGVSANIYMNNKKIGSAFEPAYGGCIQVDIERSKYEAFMEVVKSYGKEHPHYDVSFFDMTNEEYKKAQTEGTLPLNPDYNERDFIEDLLSLESHAKVYKQATKKGYNAYVVGSIITLRGNKIHRPITYFTDGSKKQFNSICKEVEKEAAGRPFLVTQYDESFFKDYHLI